MLQELLDKLDAWAILGFTAQAVFTARFVVQWVASGRAGQEPHRATMREGFRRGLGNAHRRDHRREGMSDPLGCSRSGALTAGNVLS